MIKNSYKLIGVLILIYSFVVGMIVPLTPGIVKISPQRANTGEKLTVQVKGYNTHFQQAGNSLRAWLKLSEEYAIAGEVAEVQNDIDLVLRFQVPAFLPIADQVKETSLIMDNAIDGSSVLPSAIFISQDSVNITLGDELWRKTPIEHLSERTFTTFPFRNILQETIRNTYFHVSLWFAMMFLFIAAVWNAVAYLRKSNPFYDIRSVAFTQVGLFFGLLGVATGAIWAKYTWGAYWSWDVKQNTTAIALLIYFAYFVLRNSFNDSERKARISAVYSIFAFVALIVLIYIIPRMADSLHPGNGGNPAFGGEDLDNTMRMVFYPSIIGWTLFGVWMASLITRSEKLNEQLLELE